MYELAEQESSWLTPPQEGSWEYYKRLDDEERQKEEDEEAYENKIAEAIDEVQFYASKMKQVCMNLLFVDRYSCCERCPFYKEDECVLGNPHDWEVQ